MKMPESSFKDSVNEVKFNKELVLDIGNSLSQWKLKQVTLNLKHSLSKKLTSKMKGSLNLSKADGVDKNDVRENSEHRLKSFLDTLLV